MCRHDIRQQKAALRATEPILGLLVVEDWREGNAENRALRVARLRHPTQSYHPELVLPLFEPVMVRCDRRGMVLNGFERESKGAEVATVMQAWWLRQLEGQ